MMFRCFFHRSCGVHICLNFGFDERADRLVSRFMIIIILVKVYLENRMEFDENP